MCAPARSSRVPVCTRGGGGGGGGRGRERERLCTWLIPAQPCRRSSSRSFLPPSRHPPPIYFTRSWGQLGLGGRTFFKPPFFCYLKRKKRQIKGESLPPPEMSRISLACRKSKYQLSHFLPLSLSSLPPSEQGTRYRDCKARCHTGSEGEGESMAGERSFLSNSPLGSPICLLSSGPPR